MGGTPSRGTPKDRRLKRNRAATEVDRLAGRRLLAATRMAKWQARIDRAASTALAKRRRAALTAVRSRFGAVTAAVMPVDPFDPGSWDQTVADDIEPVVRTVLAEVGASAAQSLGLDASNLPPLDVKARAAQLADWYAKLGAETSQALQEALAQSAGLGESIAQAAARIDAVFGSASSRSTMIARTELSGAASTTTLDFAHAVSDSGIALTKSWLAGNCDICQGNEDDGPIGLDDTFASGDDACPAHPGCVCTIVTDLAEDTAATPGDSAPGDEG